MGGKTKGHMKRPDMSTLSNVKTGRGQEKPPSVRVAPDTLPEAKSSQTGASVRYVLLINY